MKNLLKLFTFLTIIFLLNACSSTNSLTYCPDFNKKNKVKKSFALKLKKKQHKNFKAYTKTVESTVQKLESVDPINTIVLNSINSISKTQPEIASTNSFNMGQFISSNSSSKINENFDLESATASIKTLINEDSEQLIENLNKSKLVNLSVTKPLSKKQIKRIERKVDKFERKLKKHNQKESTTPQNSTGGQKSQLVALLLAIFVGVIGVHRFYLGYTGIGIAQIFTLGGCGVWALIDLIRIATGDLGPADGSEYDPETLLQN